MKYIKQFCIILFISFIGEILNRLIPLTIPASIYGIVILFFGLLNGIIPLDLVRETGKFFVEILPVMFIPAAVGLMESWDLIRTSWVSYIVIAVVTTIAVMAISGRVTQAILLHQKEKKNE